LQRERRSKKVDRRGAEWQRLLVADRAGSVARSKSIGRLLQAEYPVHFAGAEQHLRKRLSLTAMRDRHRKAPLDRPEPLGQINDDPVQQKCRPRVALPMRARQALAEEFFVGDLSDQAKTPGMCAGVRARGRMTRLGRRDSMPGCWGSNR